MRRRWQNRSADGTLLYLNLIDGQLKLAVDDKTRGLQEVANSDELRKLPSFYGEVISVERAGSDEDAKVRLHFSGPAVEPGTISLNNENKAALDMMISAAAAEDQASLERLRSQPGRIDLSEPIDLFVTYLTVWATRDGKIQVTISVHIAQRD